jgi:hypothetical protein
MIRKHFRLKRILVGLAFAALFAPAAQATPYAPGTGRVIESDLSVQVSPYELRGTHVLPGGMTLTPARAVRSEKVVSTASTDSFGWSDRVIVASLVFGGTLVLLTSVGLARRNRHRTGLARA